MFVIHPIPVEIPEPPRVRVERVRDVQRESTLGIYSDSSFSNQQTNFTPGATVYLKVESSIKGNNNSFELLDENKKFVKNINLEWNGNYYLGEFISPLGTGIYYVTIKIEDGSSHFSGQSNITVKGDSGNNYDNSSLVLSEVTTELSTGADDLITETQDIATDVGNMKESENSENIGLMQIIRNYWDKLMNLLFR